MPIIHRTISSIRERFAHKTLVSASLNPAGILIQLGEQMIHPTYGHT